MGTERTRGERQGKVGVGRRREREKGPEEEQERDRERPQARRSDPEPQRTPPLTSLLPPGQGNRRAELATPGSGRTPQKAGTPPGTSWQQSRWLGAERILICLPEAQGVPSAAPTPPPPPICSTCDARRLLRDEKARQGPALLAGHHLPHDSLGLRSFAGCSQGLSALERPAPWQGLGPTHLQGSGVCSAPWETAWEQPPHPPAPGVYSALELWAGEPAGKTARICAGEAPGE